LTETRPFYFEEIAESEVSPKILEKAKRVLDYCQKMLGLRDIIKIHWITQTSSAFASALEQLERALKKLAGESLEGEPKAQREPEGEFFGRVFSKRGDRIVMVRADLPLREVLLTVAHECQHVADHQIYRPPWTAEEKQVWELNAEAFAREVLRKIGE
jgi:hypothetical protein